MREAVLAGVAGTVVTGCAWFSGRLVRPLGGSRRGPLGVGHDPSGWRLHADRGGDTGGDHRARRLFRPARRVGPRERCHGQPPLGSRAAGAHPGRCTGDGVFRRHHALPAVWQAPGVSAWHRTPWQVGVRRDVVVPAETPAGGVMTVYVPLVVATVRGSAPGLAHQVLRFAIRVGSGYRVGALHRVTPIGPRLFCIANPPMGGHFSTMQGSRVTEAPSFQRRSWDVWGQSIALDTHYVLSVDARAVGLIMYDNHTGWQYMYLQRTHANGFGLKGCGSVRPGQLAECPGGRYARLGGGVPQGNPGPAGPHIRRDVHDSRGRHQARRGFGPTAGIVRP